ncbi:MAG: helix-turn-helix transcriptional regulator [Bacteroidales bacterium]|nr:helix-turn-helix transcriptional regulator [Bacteroidales bacterium]
MKPAFLDKFRLFFARGANRNTNPRHLNYSNGRTAAIIRKWIAEMGWAEDATLQEVADSLGLYKEDFSMYFRRTYHQNFLQWRKVIRIDEAKRILVKDKTIPTAIVGEEVGICDKSNFKRQFRDLTGCTPAQWRSKH